jgi:hypothetical protein
MSSFDITLNITNMDFPMLCKLKKKDQKQFIYKLLKAGYDIFFPSNEKIEKEVDHQEILEKITQLKDELKEELSNSDLETKINSLEFSLNKLIGISSNSQKKGNLGENVLEEIFSKRYGDIKFERKSGVAHSGDAWLYLPDDSIIMLESKNYTTTVNKDEITKLQFDMINHHIKWAILASFNSSIQGMKEMDYHTFTHMNETYNVVMISNLSTDMHKLDLALQIVRKLMSCIDNPSIFPWIVKDINNSIYELDEIIKKNYMLRDAYYTMETEIQSQLSSYHVKLRDYQYDIEKKIIEITNKIKSTMQESIQAKNEMDGCKHILESYQDKKILPIIVRLVDIFQGNKWNVSYEKDSNDWKLMNGMEVIGSIKVQLKKVDVMILSNDIKVSLHLGKEKENKQNLEMIKSVGK